MERLESVAFLAVEFKDGESVVVINWTDVGKGCVYPSQD